MKEIIQKSIIGYLINDYFYCKNCWKEYLGEKKMTGKMSIEEEVWEHDLFSGQSDEIEGSGQALHCCRCRCVLTPEESAKLEDLHVPD